MTRKHSSPALHNAMWPGLVGKGAGGEPPIDLETMLNLTAAAEVDGVRFDGVDLFLSLAAHRHRFDRRRPGEAGRKSFLQTAARRFARRACLGPTGGGSAMGNEEERGRFLTQVKKACRIGRKLRDLRCETMA